MPRKPKNKIYFTQDTENAIIEYNKCEDPFKRNDTPSHSGRL